MSIRFPEILVIWDRLHRYTAPSLQIKEKNHLGASFVQFNKTFSKSHDNLFMTYFYRTWSKYLPKFRSPLQTSGQLLPGQNRYICPKKHVDQLQGQNEIRIIRMYVIIKGVAGGMTEGPIPCPISQDIRKNNVYERDDGRK